MKEKNTIYSKAKIYDILFGDYISNKDLNFYEDLILEFGQPILELACGSGKITIPLAQKGYEITGLDISPEMIKLGKKKAENTPVTLLVGDM